jgi:hypothetical protein
MVKLNKTKYNKIIEKFSDHTSKKYKSNKTIIDAGNNLAKTFVKLRKEMMTEHFAANPFSKIEGFFKQIEGFFKKIKEAFTFTKEKMIAIILTIIFPFFGQLVGRIIYLNGSLDKPWLFFFSIPPLSIIPALMMMFGVIKKGKGGKPYDNYIFIPIIVTVICDFFLKKYFLPYKIPFIKLFLLITSVFMIYWFKSKKICNDKSAPVSKLLADTLLTYVSIGIVGIVLKYIPVIGIAIRIIAKIIPYSEYVVNALAIFVIYVIMNMINGSSKEYCTKGASAGMIIGLIIFTIILGFVKK